MVTYKTKVCKLCGKKYTPTSPRQKYCPKCKDEGRRIADRKRDRRRTRIANNYKQYKRVCPICGREFITYYSKKIYCGSDDCEATRVIIKNRNYHKLRDKKELIEKGRVYYYNNRKRCLLTKAAQYRKRHPNAKSYIMGKPAKLTIEYVRDYVEQRGYKLLSKEYINSTTKIKLLCPYGHEWETTFYNFRDSINFIGNRCRTCYLENNYTSRPEQKIRDIFIHRFPDIKVIYNDRVQIYPKELDLYLPDYNLAIEVCGLYWHSDTANSIPRSYHYDKMMFCKQKGIRLITIFEDEIIYKFDLIESIIIQAIHRTACRIHARKCALYEVNNTDAVKFFDGHHLCGACSFEKVFGLYYGEDLVAAMSVGTISGKYSSVGKTLELKRVCSSINTVVVGGVSKLLKKVILYAKVNGYDNIKVCCDMRYTNIFNPVYEILGFTLTEFTKYIPHYFKGGKRSSITSLRKTKEKPIVTETEVDLIMTKGYNRIWDCGYRTYMLLLN